MSMSVDQREMSRQVRRFSLLSPTRLRIAELVADGYGNKEIAALVGLAESTVKNHLAALYWDFEFSHRYNNRVLLARLVWEARQATGTETGRP